MATYSVTRGCLQPSRSKLMIRLIHDYNKNSDEASMHIPRRKQCATTYVIF